MLLLSLFAALAVSTCFVPSSQTCTAGFLLNVSLIPKFVNQISAPPVFVPNPGTTSNYTVSMSAFEQQILPPGFPKTPVWGYVGLARQADGSVGLTASSPGPTFEVRRIEWRLFWPFVFDALSSGEAVRGCVSHLDQQHLLSSHVRGGSDVALGQSQLAPSPRRPVSSFPARLSGGAGRCAFGHAPSR